MKEREAFIVSGLVVFLLVLWLGAPFHQSPRFAGSLIGGLFGVAGSMLMLVPLAYLFIKRIPPLKQLFRSFVSMRTLLAWHIYAGVIGPILVLIHTGHKYNSLLGIILTTMVLTVVISGFIGRYLMTRIQHEIIEKKQLLAQAVAEYDRALEEIRSEPQTVALLNPFKNVVLRFMLSFYDSTGRGMPLNVRIVRLSETISDLEYAIKSHALFKKIFSAWLKLHIALSMLLYALMGLHIWAAIHFGIRWFP